MIARRTAGRVQPIYAGVDGGGTRCRALLADARGVELGAGSAGPANPFQDPRQAAASVVEAVEAALSDAGCAPSEIGNVVACVGLAGANVKSAYERMVDWDHPFCDMQLTTDVEIACLGAHGGLDGGVVVVGTGSSGCALVDGEWHYLGGYGFPFADKGSGAWFGLEAIRAVLLDFDELGPPTALRGALREETGFGPLELVDFMSGARPARFASIAPLVVDAAGNGDAVAAGILRDGSAYLSDLVVRLVAFGAPAVALVGGLSGKLLPWLGEDAAARVVPAQKSAEHGALLSAMHSGEAQTRERGAGDS